MRKIVGRWQQSRVNAGLAAFDAAERRAGREWRAVMRAIATTRATTRVGVIAKLRLIQSELHDGSSGFGEDILASAIADILRLTKKK